MPTNDDPKAQRAQALDPRFDPAFQRGYRPGAARPEAPDAVTQVPTSDRVAQGAAPFSSPPPATRPPEGRQPEEAIPTGVPVDDSASTPSDGQEGHETPLHASRANPYLRALWIIGIGCVVAGIALQLWAQTEAVNVSYDPQGGVPLNAVLLNLAYSVGSPLITTGLATVVGLLFLLAVRHRDWRRR
ncbi:MAG TPA: hypothetical protein VIJ18_12610 [Microbacteriaceae bacterium]